MIEEIEPYLEGRMNISRLVANKMSQGVTNEGMMGM